MKTTYLKNIHSYDELKKRIVQLEAVVDEKEDAIKTDVELIYQELQPKNLVRNLVKDVAGDEHLKAEGTHALGSMATDFMIKKIFNPKNTIKGFLASLLVEKVALPLIKNNKEKITSFIGKMVPKKKEPAYE